MENISHSEFSERMKKAVMICSPEYGHYVNVEKRSPYYQKPFVVPEELDTFCFESETGMALKLSKGNEIILCAYIF